MLTTEELEHRMRPGQYSVKGFLGKSEKLKEVIERDQETLNRFNLTHAVVASTLDNLISTTLSLHKRSAEFYPYEINIEVFKGFQICPWSENPHHGQCTAGEGVRNASIDWKIYNKRNKLKVSGPGLIVHLIRDHQFFEGFESPYRVDPEKLASVLELIN